MSASDVRRGPGWWMDLEGGWNPPETWPETTPPLPGWTRTDDGRWAPPAAEDGSLREATEAEAAEIERRVDAATRRPQLRLTYAEPAVRPAEPAAVWSRPSPRSAALAAIAAAVIAVMIAVGLIVLFSLF